VIEITEKASGERPAGRLILLEHLHDVPAIFSDISEYFLVVGASTSRIVFVHNE
jgi:hypothetical protein